jgi:hypothetical protein
MKPLPVPRQLVTGKPASFTFQLAPPQDGWKSTARLRAQFDTAPSPGEWKATFNGETIPATSEISEPFPVPYPAMLGKPNELRAWTVPATLLHEGTNRLELSFQGSNTPNLIFLDLATP